ncbi:putative lyase [Arabidopsis thaliana]
MIILKLILCMRRWDPNGIYILPDYMMKTVFSSLLGMFSNRFKLYSKANLSYAEWAQGDIVPTFDEYLEIGGVEVSMYVTVSCSFLGLVQTARRKSYEWLKSRRPSQ